MAIALDATSHGTGTNTVTFSHTCTGTNLILWVGGKINAVALWTGVTYNGVALTKSDAIRQTADEAELWYLVAPATGAHNIVISVDVGAATTYAYGASYTGAAQTGVPDAHGTNSTASGTSLSKAITTVAANCWMVGSVWDNSGNNVAASGTTLRETTYGSVSFLDSNGALSAGSNSLGVTWTGASNASMCVASFAPFVAAGPTNVKTWDGLALSSVKTIGGLAIASVKSILGIT